MEQFGTLVGSISGTTIGTIVIGTLTGSIRGSCWTLIGSVSRSMEHLKNIFAVFIDRAEFDVCISSMSRSSLREYFKDSTPQ